MRLCLLIAISLATVMGFTSCGSVGQDDRNKMVVSIRDQRMMLVRDGKPVKSYKISTSKFGVGDKPKSNCTPLGRMEISRKIGDNAPAGAVFKARRPTGEVIKPNAPGRDPIVSRILWLKGTQAQNRNAFKRFIYIHGTPEERRLGTPASYGCIRMGERDVIDLYKRVGLGADVFIIRGSLTSVKSSLGLASATQQ